MKRLPVFRGCLNFENLLVLSLKATDLIASGESRRKHKNKFASLKVTNKTVAGSTLSASERIFTPFAFVSLALYPTLLNLSLSAISAEI